MGADDLDLFWCEFCQMDSRTDGHDKFHTLGLTGGTDAPQG